MIICHIMFVVYLLFGVSLAETSARWTCSDGEVPCLWENGTCIYHQHWCDGEIDCGRGSDEHFCNGTNDCLDNHFKCGNKRCVPLQTVCNGYDNCGDGSDETCGGSHRNTTDYSKSVLAVVSATHYLLSERKSDYGWDDFTARALTALAFGQKYSPISQKQKISMTKRLDVQLLFLLRNGVKNLASLALHINALYAMCKDPRDFHGIDLVDLLRSETDKAMKSDFNLPIVFLTLCLANDTRSGDFNRLLRIYDDKRNNRLGVKALTLIAMSSCILKQRHHPYGNDLLKRINDFKMNQDRNIDIYSKALICQAYNAFRYDTTELQNELLAAQSEDGSFGDIFGTYSVIPALLNESLADLQCKTRNYKAKPGRRSSTSFEQIFKPERQMDYSLLISDGKNAGHHTLRLTYEGDKSFYDLMKIAELRNPMYRFKYDELEGTGKKVYYLAGIPNDAEKGLTWNLYRRVADSMTENITKDKLKQTEGIDKIFPEDGDNFIFELERKI